MVVSTTKQVLFQLQPKGILYGGYRTALCGSIDTAKWLTKMGLYLLMMSTIALLFQRKLNFISAHTSIASVATYTDKI